VQLRVSDLAAAVGGRVHGPDVTVDGASIDSRTVTPGALFVPLVAERDGHDFVEAALAAGAAAYLTSRTPVGGTAVVVADTASALSAAGSHARSLLPEPVIGITGSVGKTSVKDLLAAILAEERRVAASERSFNNELGVPITLLNAPDGTEAVVLEMGARGIGHVAELCAIGRPTVGVVTRVAAVHTETFGTVDDIALAKGELIESLPATGTAILNGRDERVAAMAGRTTAAIVRYAVGDVVAEHVTLDDDLRPRFELRSPWGDAEVRLGVRGVHMVDNALAAAAAALACGASVEAVARGLGAAQLSPWRMSLERLPSGARVLNDAYNANPTSMLAALESLSHLPAERRVAVLGVMAELGDGAAEEHAAITAEAAMRGIRVISVGCPEYGGDLDVPDVVRAAEALGGLGPDDAVLVKGSRVAGLERLVELLVEGG
jgi:UDP-N-acetylmuramoyl-tripeptide--D-alanyl-D-alanine ligase